MGKQQLDLSLEDRQWLAHEIAAGRIVPPSRRPSTPTRRKPRGTRREKRVFRRVATLSGPRSYIDSDWTDEEWAAIEAAMARRA